MNYMLKKLVAGFSALAIVSTFGVSSVFADQETTTYTAEVLLNDYDKPLMSDEIHGDTNLEDMEYIHYEMSDIQDTLDALNNLSNAEYTSDNVTKFNELDNQVNKFYVKYHRTGFENGNIQAVMDGDIDGFINAYLKSLISKE